MRIGRRTITVAGTFFLAAATGHVMQSGFLVGKRLTSAGPGMVVGELTQASLISADGDSDPTPALPADDLAAVRQSVPDFPELPGLEPMALSSGIRLASRMDDIQSDVSWPETAANLEYDNFGQPCTAPKLALALSAPAMIDVTVMAACHANERIVISHAGISFAGTTDEKGHYHAVVPAMTGKGEITAQLGPDLSLRDYRTVPDIGWVNRLALVQRGQNGLHLNAFIGDAEFGSDMHLRPENTGAASTGSGGYLTVLGDAALDRPIVTEVVTFPASQPAPRLQVVADVTDKTCGRDLLGSTLRTASASGPTMGGLSLAVPGCDSVGERVVLDMERADAAVALASSSAQQQQSAATAAVSE